MPLHLHHNDCVNAYLRAAQAYMLISMPTDTSTILGAFQDISALLVGGTIGPVGDDKVMRLEKIASDFFRAAPQNEAGQSSKRGA